MDVSSVTETLGARGLEMIAHFSIFARYSEKAFQRETGISLAGS